MVYIEKLIDCCALLRYRWRRRVLFRHIHLHPGFPQTILCITHVCVCVHKLVFTEFIFGNGQAEAGHMSILGLYTHGVLGDRLCHDLIRPSVPPINCIAYSSTAANLAGEKRCSLSIRSFYSPSGGISLGAGVSMNSSMLKHK